MDDFAKVVVTDVVEHENGEATYSFDMDSESSKKVIEEGLRFILFCGVAQVDIQEVYDWILLKGKEKGVAKDASDFGLPVALCDYSKSCPYYLPPSNS